MCLEENYGNSEPDTDKWITNYTFNYETLKKIKINEYLHTRSSDIMNCDTIHHHAPL